MSTQAPGMVPDELKYEQNSKGTLTALAKHLPEAK